MLHFGFLSHPHTGHLNPMLALACELQGRGHTTTFFQIPDVEQSVSRARVGFCRVAEKQMPVGTVQKWDEELSRLTGVAGLRFTLETILLQQSEAFFRVLPQALLANGINALVIDQVAVYGGLIAERLGIPFVSVANGIPMNRDDELPPCFTSWNPWQGRIGRMRNRAGYLFAGYLARFVQELIRKQRRFWGLTENPSRKWRPLAGVAQLPKCLEFPRTSIPSNFHYAGPFFDRRTRPEETWRRTASDKPLVYASMGTLLNGRGHIFCAIAEACARANVELIMSLGGGPLSRKYMGSLPGNPTVMPYAPQLAILKHAALVITHAGLNTALETLRHGIPMVAIPITSDQPGVAARLAWAGAAEIVPESRISPEKLCHAVRHVLSDVRFRSSARRLQAEICSVNGVQRAADIVERAFLDRAN
jgi:zeaxanthin glucosyltransferase